MSKKLLRVLFTIFVVGGVFLVAVKAQTTAAAPIGQAESGPEIESQLLDQIEKNGSAGYLIYFREKADLSAAASLTWEARGDYVMSALQQAADNAQANVRAYLDAQGVKYQSFWIDNIISVEESSLAVLKDLQSFPEIEVLRAHRTMGLIEPVEESAGQLPGLFTVEPNIVHVGAPGAWALGYTGTGRVVSSIDTGVRYTHQALNAQYRGNLGNGSYNHNYNWFDPYGDHPTSPADDNGHGTHTMGTMVGDDGGANQIGMAPDAEWLACRGCNTSSCSDTALLTCAQFIAAPTDLTGANPNPDMRPDAVNNSWGDCGQSYDNWYQGVVNSWHAAGIYPLFANGNASNCGYSSPPPCGTVGNPGRYGNVTGVGSTGQSNGAYASHSNRGPTDNLDPINGAGFPTIKPQVSAPGVNIRSSVNDSDTAYEGGWSGTSMSTPHVTALVALIWQAAPCLVGDYAATETLIQDTATPVVSGLPGTCSGEGPGQYPNQSTGWGEIDALAAVTAAQGMCGPQGSLGGTVTAAAGGAPIEDADIAATLSVTQTYTTQTGPDGTYLFGSLNAGTYDVTASKFGYLPDTATDVVVVSGTLTTQNFALVQADSTTVSGVVSDEQTGWPLYAQVSFTGAPLDPIWTDPVTGAYSVVLPQGITYTLTASAWVPGYLPTDVEVNPIGSAMTVDIELTADPVSCSAPGYNFSGGYVQNFDGATVPNLPADWSKLLVYDPGTDPNWLTKVGTRYPSGYAAHSAPNLVYFNSFSTGENGAMLLYRNIPFDMTSLSGTTLSFWMFHDTGYSSDTDRVQVKVSTDSGATWVSVGPEFLRYAPASNVWTQHSVDLSAYSSSTNLMIGFLATSSYGNDIHLDDILLGSAVPVCGPSDGGLVVGEVLDANTSLGLPGAVVSNELGSTATAQATVDPAVGDAFYTIFAPQGSTLLTATLPASQYGDDTFNPTIVDGTTIWHDFELPAGWLSATPSPLTGTAAMGSSTTVPLTLVNNGGLSLTYEFTERDQGFVPSAGEDVVVVAYDTTSATAVEAALTANGFTYLQVSDATFQSTPVDQLLEYTAVFYTGNPTANGASETKMKAYLDAGGQLFISDNDLGYSRSGSNVFYNTYLQATYKEDDGGTSLTGEGDFTGINLNISTDPYPDSFTVGAEGTRIYYFSDNDAGGVQVVRADYKAIYIATDFRYITNTAEANALVNEIMGQFALDVPWLSENPVSGTLDPGANVVVNVTMDATSLGVPGTYLADLKVKNNTAYGTVTVPVEFTVTAPAGFGKLEGTVTGLGYCDADPAPLEGAEVVIVGATDTFTVTTDANGYYFQWINAVANPSLDIEVSADEHTPGEASNVLLPPGATVTKDFDLRWLVPCESATPESVTETLLLGETSTQQLTLENSGAGVLDWTVSEQPGLLRVLESATPVSTALADRLVTLGDTALSTNPNGVSGSATPSAPVVPNSTTITHSLSQTITSLNSVSCNAGGIHTDNHYLRTFTLTDFGIAQPFNVINVQIGIEEAAGGSGGTQPAEIRLYTLNGPLVWANLTLLASAPVNVADGQLVIITMPVSANVPAGSTLVVDFFTPDGDAAGNSLFVGSNSLGETAPTYLAAADCGIPEPATTASIGFPNMHLVMNVTGNVGGGNDAVPWLDESPTSGTVPAPGSQDVTLSFDTTVLSQPGDYFADLRFVTNSPASPLVVPVTLTVTAPNTYGLLDGTVTSLGYCDANPAPLEGAQVVIDGGTGTFTATTDAAGYYSWWLDESASPLTVSVTAPEHTGDSVDGVQIVAGATTTVDVDLNWLKPCAGAEPTELEVVVAEGKSKTVPLTVTNDGAGVLDFTFSEENGTPLAAMKAPSDIGDAWETMAPLPAGRVFNAVVADDDGYVYVLGGTSDAGGATKTNTNYRYDTATNTWATMAPMPAAVSSPDGAFINGKIYIPGDGATASTFVYDVAANTWSTIAANGGYSAREQYQVVAIGSNLYVLGGIAGSASTTQVWVLNTQTETWAPGVAMQKSRTSFSAEAINGQIYVAGGVLFPGFVPDMTAEKFDGTAWSYIADVPNGGGAYTRWSYNADGLGDGVLWLAAGRRDTGWAVLNHAGYYDPATDTWTTSPTIPTLSQGRVYMEGAVATDGYFYVIGGRDAAGATIYATNERLLVGVSVTDVPWLSEDPLGGSIPAYSMDDFNITFTALPTLTLSTYTATLNIVSNDPVNDVLPVPVTMHIATPGVDLSPATAAMSGDPGATVDYNLTVTNTGSYTDTFDVDVTSAWVTNAPVAVGPLAAGDSASFVVTVHIPAGALAGVNDTAVVKVSSAIDPEVSDQAQLTTTANTVYGVQVMPPTDAKSGNPGAVVTYLLTVTNTGNASDTFDVTVTGEAWTTVAPTTVGPLLPGASTTVEVTVTIPSSPTSATSDVALVTFTSQGDNTKSDSSELTTTVGIKRFFLPFITKN